jgi:hypothetical protein
MFHKGSIWSVLLILGVALVLWGFQQAAAQGILNSKPFTTTSDPVIGYPFTISTAAIDEIKPAVAYDPLRREYLVVWQNERSGTDDIYAQRISEQGELLSWFFVAEGNSPELAFNPKNNTYLIVYDKWVSTDYDVYARRVDFTGPLGSEFLIAFNLNETEHSPTVAYNTHPNYDEFLVVWENIPPPPSTINRVEGQRVAGTAGGGDAGGETIASRLPIAQNSDYNLDPDIAYNLNMNEFLVVFTRQPGGGGNYDVFGRRITANGVLLAEASIDSSGNDQYNPSVAADHLNQTTPYFVVFNDKWNDTAGDVRGYLVNQQGQPVLLVNIAQNPGQSEFDPAISENETSGGYLVSWVQGPSGNTDIFGMQISNIGYTNPEFDLSKYGSAPTVCDRGQPDIAVGISTALGSWQDSCGSAGGVDIVGRMIGYRVYLPLVMR